MCVCACVCVCICMYECVCVCMYVYVCMYAYVCMYVCMNFRDNWLNRVDDLTFNISPISNWSDILLYSVNCLENAYVHTCIHTYVHTYTHIYTYTHTYIHAFIHMHTCTHTSIYIDTYINTYIHIHTHIHTHTHAYILTPVSYCIRDDIFFRSDIHIIDWSAVWVWEIKSQSVGHQRRIDFWY